MNLLIRFLFLFIYFTIGVFSQQDLKKLFYGYPVLFSNVHEKISIGTLPPRKDIPIADKVASDKVKDLLQSGKILTSPFILNNLESSQVNFANILNANIRLKNLVIEGLQDIQIRKLDMHMKGLRVDLEFAIPNLIVNVDYDVDATVLGMMDYKPSGHTRLIIQNYLFSGSAAAKITKMYNSKYIQVKALEGDVFVKNAKLQISGLNNDKSVGNKLLGIATNMHVNTIKKTIIKKALMEILQDVNEYLKRIPLKNILSLIA